MWAPFVLWINRESQPHCHIIPIGGTVTMGHIVSLHHGTFGFDYDKVGYLFDLPSPDPFGA